MIIWCARAQEAVWLTAAVAVPVVFNPWGCNAFEAPKSALLQGLVLLMGLAAAVQGVEALVAPGRSRRDGAALWLGLAFGLVVILATVVSVNPRTSLWGSYERRQGLLTLGAYVALFLLTATGLRTRAQAERLLTAIVWGSAPVIAYALLQAAAWDPLVWRTDAASPVLSTIGRANFLGSYLVLALPLTAGRALLARRRWPYVALVAGQLACLSLTGARGAWVGFAAAALTFGLAWALAAHNRRLALATLAFVVLVAGFVLFVSGSGNPLSGSARVPGDNLLATSHRTDVGSPAARLTIWRTTLPLIASRPWLGYGPETMRTVFAHVFPPQLVYYQGRHTSVDRAHNLWLDLAMSVGLTGLVAFGALLASVGLLAWRGLRSAADGWERAVWVALTAAVMGHLIDLQFNFDLTATATIFWLLLGLAAAVGRGLTRSTQDVTAAPKPTTAWLPYLPPLLATLALMGLLCLRPLLADAACWQAQQSKASLNRRLAAAERAARLWSLEPEYHLRLSRLYFESGNPAAAQAQLVAADSLSPNDPLIWTARGDLYAMWGEAQPQRYPQAEAAYQRALDLAPDVATTHTALGLVLVRQGRLEEGLAQLERAVDLDATDAVAYRHLADLYQALGRTAQADWARREAARWSGE